MALYKVLCEYIQDGVINVLSVVIVFLFLTTMRFMAGVYSVFIVVCAVLTDGRLVPFSSLDGGQLVIEAPTYSVVSIPTARKQGWLDWEETGKEPPVEGTSVCYPVVGCFDNYPPFDNAALEVPQDPSIVDTHFLLFTRTTPTQPDLLQYNKNDQSILNSKFNSSQWLRIIVHGFTNNRQSAWISRLTEELLKLKEDEASSVLVVDWGNGAKFPLYNTAAANTRLVGKQIGLLLKKMRTLKQLSYSKVHCIGHSLGAHTCAYASNEISQQIARISGLDPAGPFFQGKDLTVRLDPSDAKLIDVIHSNTDFALGVGLGSSDPSGHLDFFVNGGKQQPGCPSVGSLISGQSEAGFEQATCSHGRSHGYFIESISSHCPYTAYPCQDFESFRKGKCLACPAGGCAHMGFRLQNSMVRGNMYLATKSNSPFCGSHYYVELVLSPDMPKTIGEIYIGIYSNYELLANVSMTHKPNADLKANDVLRHVFSLDTDLSTIDYAVAYFNKGKAFLNLGGPYGNNVVISRLQLKSADNTILNSAACDANVVLPMFTEHTVLLNRFDCENEPSVKHK